MNGKLTPTFISKLQPKATEYLVSDGNNLYLAIKPNSAEQTITLS